MVHSKMGNRNPVKYEPRTRWVRLVIILLVLIMPVAPSLSSFISASPTTVTSTQHVKLGFTLSFPINKGASDKFACVGDNCAFRYSVSFTGTALFAVDLEADITLSYDIADVIPGGILPVHITYTPTASSVAVTFPGTSTISFTGCSNCPAHPPVNLGTGSLMFTPLLDSDQAVTLHALSDTIKLSAGKLDMAEVHLDSSLTLSPVSGQGLGLSGAVAVIGANNGAKANIPMALWDKAGQTVSINIQLPNAWVPSVDVTLGPVLHWLGTAPPNATVKAVIHFTDAFKGAVFGLCMSVLPELITCGIVSGEIGDPDPVTILNRNLGDVFHDAKLDSQIGNEAFPNDPNKAQQVAGQVAMGYVPIPLLDPALPTIHTDLQEKLSLGQIVFSIRFPYTTTTYPPTSTETVTVIHTFVPCGPQQLSTCTGPVKTISLTQTNTYFSTLTLEFDGLSTHTIYQNTPAAASVQYIPYTTTTTFTTLTTQLSTYTQPSSTAFTTTQTYTGLLTSTGTATGGGIYNTTFTTTFVEPVTLTTTTTNESTSISCNPSSGCYTQILPGNQTITLTTNEPSTLFVTQAATSNGTYTSTLQTTGFSTLTITNSTGGVYTSAFTMPITLQITETGTSTITVTPSAAGPKCIIATAAYGSELAPPVQFLRNFRDTQVERTHLGSQFLSGFNAWYYSWAPAVARQEAGNSMLRAGVRVAILPLLGALFVAQGIFVGLAGVNSELAIVAAGFAASALIGVAYLTPLAFAVKRVMGKRLGRKTLLYASVFAAMLALLGTLTHGTMGVPENLTAIFVLECMILSPIALTLKLQPKREKEPRLKHGLSELNSFPASLVWLAISVLAIGVAYGSGLGTLMGIGTASLALSVLSLGGILGAMALMRIQFPLNNARIMFAIKCLKNQAFILRPFRDSPWGSVASGKNIMNNFEAA